VVVLLPLLWCGSAAYANGIIHDPSMAVEAGDFSSALYPGTNFVPTADGGGMIGFYNATNHYITVLQFQAYIATFLDDNTIQASFACAEGNISPFFKECSVQYVPTTGLLAFSFWDTNPLTGSETGDQAGAQKGIPTLLPGCAATPDAVGCNDVGHFAINLNNNFFHVGDSGGWNNTNSPGLFLPSGPVFIATQISTIFGDEPIDLPEPATLAMMGGALVALGWMLRRRSRSPG
jgi:hypothetical protein